MSILAELIDTNFAYRWSYTDNFNTAVMAINLIDEAGRVRADALYARFVNDASSWQRLISYLHPMSMRARLLDAHSHADIFAYENLKMLHTCLFDPAWLCFDGRLNRRSDMRSDEICSPTEFTNRNVFANSRNRGDEFRAERFFPGAFAFHLHLTMKHFKIIEGSYFSQFESFWSQKLNVKL